MKTIKSKANGTIERVSNITASERVQSGQWVYTPKKEWKELGKQPKTE